MGQRPIKIIHAGALMPRPRGVAEFTKTVAEFTKSSLAGQKLLQEWKIFIIVAIKMPRRMIRGASFKPKARRGR